MTNLYDVMNLTRTASPEVVDAAYLAMRRRYTDSGETAKRDEIEAAYEVLGNPAKRAEYDASLDAAAAPVAPEPVAVATVAEPAASAESSPWAAPGSASATAPLQPVVVKSSNRKLLFALTGMVVVLIAITGAGLGYFLLKGDGGGGDFKVGLADDKYDLPKMALVDGDVPDGITLANEQDFDNAAWAEALTDPESPDPEAALAAKQRQLEAQGRVRGYVKFYQAENAIEHLGKPFQFASQTSLFKDEQSAMDAMKDVCDLPLDTSGQVDDAEVKKIGNESTAFYITTPSGDLGLGNFKDTVVCFRTGRLVHSISQRGLDGTEDLDLNVQMAESMMEHIKAALDSAGS